MSSLKLLNYPFLLAAAVAVSATPHAAADRKAGAPIEYVGQGSVPRANTAATQDPWRGPVIRSNPSAPPQQRVQLNFSYPGSTGPVSTRPQAQMASIESTPRASGIQRSASPAWPQTQSIGTPTAQPVSAPRSLVLGAGARNSLTDQRPKSVTPDFLNAYAEETGIASWYGEAFHGNTTANGETFDMYAMTAAHRTLPLPSLAQVINEANGKEIVVRVNDRGPFVDDSIIDLSMKAASALDIVDQGEAKVTVRYLGPAPEVASKPVQLAQLETTADPVRDDPKPRTDLYGDILIGGVEPSLGVPDPGQTVATPARISIATPPAPKPDFDLSPAPVREASLDSALTTTGPAPRPLQAAATPSASHSVPKFQPKIFVQVGSFADISNAQGMNAQVGGTYPVDIESVRVHGADYFRVLVGPFPTRSAADMAKYQLSQRGITDGFVVLR